MGWSYYALLGVVLVCGLALLGWLYAGARRVERAQERRLALPPDRPVPGLAPGASAPGYVTSRASHERGADTDLADAERDALRARLADVEPLPAGWADRELVTDEPSGWAVLAAPLVAVVPEGLGSVRELLPLLEHSDGRPLVIVGPLEQGALDSVRATARQGLRRLLAVDAGPETCRLAAQATEATALRRTSLQAGYLPAGSLGTCGRWVSDRRHSWILPD